MKYLALGDSYTIGETLAFEDNFPSQTCKLVNKTGINLQLETLIAITGWTTDELMSALQKEKPHLEYDWVTLLIGVNNQYRERSEEEYTWQFYALLCQAVLYAKGNPKRVIVLSIPDWGLTPFNDKKDKQAVSTAIDKFNEINLAISSEMGCHYIDVTTSTRAHAQDLKYLANDQLHYSASEYEIWAEKVASIITKHS